MVDLLDLQKSFILAHLGEGDIAADFTMGNGHDTEFLCRTVGENGHVYAFDIQAAALESTAKNLENAGVCKNYTLIHDSHHNAKNYIKEKIKAGMFNLGWLPGSGNKAVTTKLDTTLIAVRDAIDMLDSDGIILIAVYPGHEEGTREGQALSDMLSEYDRRKFSVSKFRIINSPTSPYFMIIENR